MNFVVRKGEVWEHTGWNWTRGGTEVYEHTWVVSGEQRPPPHSGAASNPYDPLKSSASSKARNKDES